MRTRTLVLSITDRPDEHHFTARLGLCALPAVLFDAYIVRELPLYAIRWLVIVVVIYTAISMLPASAVIHCDEQPNRRPFRKITHVTE